MLLNIIAQINESQTKYKMFNFKNGSEINKARNK